MPNKNPESETGRRGSVFERLGVKPRNQSSKMRPLSRSSSRNPPERLSGRCSAARDRVGRARSGSLKRPASRSRDSPTKRLRRSRSAGASGSSSSTITTSVTSREGGDSLSSSLLSLSCSSRSTSRSFSSGSASSVTSRSSSRSSRHNHSPRRRRRFQQQQQHQTSSQVRTGRNYPASAVTVPDIEQPSAVGRRRHRRAGRQTLPRRLPSATRTTERSNRRTQNRTATTASASQRQAGDAGCPLSSSVVRGSGAVSSAVSRHTAHSSSAGARSRVSRRWSPSARDTRSATRSRSRDRHHIRHNYNQNRVGGRSSPRRSSSPRAARWRARRRRSLSRSPSVVVEARAGSRRQQRHSPPPNTAGRRTYKPTSRSPGHNSRPSMLRTSGALRDGRVTRSPRSVTSCDRSRHGVSRRTSSLAPRDQKTRGEPVERQQQDRRRTSTLQRREERPSSVAKTAVTSRNANISSSTAGRRSRNETTTGRGHLASGVTSPGRVRSPGHRPARANRSHLDWQSKTRGAGVSRSSLSTERTNVAQRRRRHTSRHDSLARRSTDSDAPFSPHLDDLVVHDEVRCDEQSSEGEVSNSSASRVKTGAATVSALPSSLVKSACAPQSCSRRAGVSAASSDSGSDTSSSTSSSYASSCSSSSSSSGEEGELRVSPRRQASTTGRGRRPASQGHSGGRDRLCAVSNTSATETATVVSATATETAPQCGLSASVSAAVVAPLAESLSDFSDNDVDDQILNREDEEFEGAVCGSPPDVATVTSRYSRRGSVSPHCGHQSLASDNDDDDDDDVSHIEPESPTVRVSSVIDDLDLDWRSLLADCAVINTQQQQQQQPQRWRSRLQAQLASLCVCEAWLNSELKSEWLQWKQRHAVYQDELRADTWPYHVAPRGCHVQESAMCCLQYEAGRPPLSAHQEYHLRLALCAGGQCDISARPHSVECSESGGQLSLMLDKLSQVMQLHHWQPPLTDPVSLHSA